MDLTAFNEIAEDGGPGEYPMADESSGTIKKRFDAIGVECVEDNRRDYRELLFRSDAMNQYISGVILFEETFTERRRWHAPGGPDHQVRRGSPGHQRSTRAPARCPFPRRRDLEA